MPTRSSGSRRSSWPRSKVAYGTDPTPTGAANAMLMTNVEFSPMEGEDVSRDLEFPYLAAQAQIPVGLRVRLRGRVELAPSGAAGTAPAWGPLLSACGVAETIVAGTSVTYDPITDDMELVTIYFWLGGTRHKIARRPRQRHPALRRASAPVRSNSTSSASIRRRAEATPATPTLTAFQKPRGGHRRQHADLHPRRRRRRGIAGDARVRHGARQPGRAAAAGR